MSRPVQTKHNVICIKWGDYYSADDVNKLCSGVQRNTSRDVDFYCFTDDAEGLAAGIIAKPLPVLNVPDEDNRFAYRKEAGLCDDTLGGLHGQRVFFFDLDSLIVGNLDEFFDYPQGDQFYIINDWKHRRGRKANQVGQASCYSFVVGTLGYVKEHFEARPKEVIAEYWTASQEYLSAKVIERSGRLNFWPDNWFKSFRFHCIPNYVMRWFAAPKMPRAEGLKMIAFHGDTGIQEAMDGVWCASPRSRKYPRGWKRLYKHIRPTPWIKDYWQ